MGTRRPMSAVNTGTEETYALSAWPGGPSSAVAPVGLWRGAGGGGVPVHGNGGYRSRDGGCTRGYRPAPDVERRSRSPAYGRWRRDHHRSVFIRVGCRRRFPRRRRTATSWWTRLGWSSICSRLRWTRSPNSRWLQSRESPTPRRLRSV